MDYSKFTLKEEKLLAASPFFLASLQTICDYFGEDRVDVWENYKIVIYFPQLTVKNSASQSIIIKDFYVIIRGLHADTNRVFREVFRIDYTKSSFTLKEALIGYINSHCSKYSPVKWNDYSLKISKANLSTIRNGTGMCNGGDSTPMNLIVDALRSLPDTAFKETNVDYILQLCMALDSSIRWESIEGGPMCRMQTVKDVNVSPTAQNNLTYVDIESAFVYINDIKINNDNFAEFVAKEILIQLNNYYKNLPSYIDFNILNITKSYTTDDGYIYEIDYFIDDNTLDYLILKIIDKYSLYNILNIMSLNKDSNGYYKMLSNDDIDIKEDIAVINSTELFKFRQKVIYLKLYDLCGLNVKGLSTNNEKRVDNISIIPELRKLINLYIKKLIK